MRHLNPQLELIPQVQWVPQNGRPLIIAGPCSAESEEQVMQTAREVKKIPGVTVFRAGVWKPRTRPNGFEGVGVTALKWLKNVQEETGLQTAVEVARAQHVYEALKYGVDILWIGARTSVNPFSVQEIADALQGADLPVWVKNPINPDLNLWIGALERLNQAGIRRLGAIHRGFSTYEKTPYRNAPKWEIPIELKRLVPDIPIICDPSHISGKREIIPSLSQKALDMAMNGLMIETHINPEKALSDAAQQLPPHALKDILDNLQYRKPQGDGVDPQEFLATLRYEIDLADSQLLEAIARRDEIVCKIGLYKKNHNMTILQVSRWQQLLEHRLEQAGKLGLDEGFIKGIYQLLHDRSIQIQSALMNRKT
jgi:chorismate mutase